MEWIRGGILGEIVSPSFLSQVDFICSFLNLSKQTFWTVSALATIFIELFLAFFIHSKNSLLSSLSFHLGIFLHLSFELSGLQIGEFTFLLLSIYLLLLPKFYISLLHTPLSLLSTLFNSNWFSPSFNSSLFPSSSLSPLSSLSPIKQSEFKWLSCFKWLESLLVVLPISILGIVLEYLLDSILSSVYVWSCCFLLFLSSTLFLEEEKRKRKSEENKSGESKSGESKSGENKSRKRVVVCFVIVLVVVVLFYSTKAIPLFHFEKAQDFGRRGKVKECIQSYEECILLCPSCKYCVADAAFFYELSGDLEKAWQLGEYLLNNIHKNDIKSLTSKLRILDKRSSEGKEKIMSKEICQFCVQIEEQVQLQKDRVCSYFESAQICELEKSYISQYTPRLLKFIKNKYSC